MFWYIAAAVLLAVAGSILVAGYVFDRRYLKRKTSEAMGRELWNEIQEERESSKERREKFEAALEHADSSPRTNRRP